MIEAASDHYLLSELITVLRRYADSSFAVYGVRVFAEKHMHKK
jgi:hypothetical protein